jgi:hypothetical protein
VAVALQQEQRDLFLGATEAPLGELPVDLFPESLQQALRLFSPFLGSDACLLQVACEFRGLSPRGSGLANHLPHEKHDRSQGNKRNHSLQDNVGYCRTGDDIGCDINDHQQGYQAENHD